MAYWLAEEGHEELGWDEFDEVGARHIEGQLYVTCAGQEFIAGPGDTVVVRHRRAARMAARELTRVFFICYPVSDPTGYEAMVHRAMTEKGP